MTMTAAGFGVRSACQQHADTAHPHHKHFRKETHLNSSNRKIDYGIANRGPSLLLEATRSNSCADIKLARSNSLGNAGVKKMEGPIPSEIVVASQKSQAYHSVLGENKYIADKADIEILFL